MKTDEAQRYLQVALADRRNKQAPLVLGVPTPEVVAALETLGAKTHDRFIALDHDCTLHIHDGHGLDKEAKRGQIPITGEDLGSIAGLVNSAIKIDLGTPSHSKNGSLRVAVYSEGEAFRYWLVLEIRKRLIVPFTFYKRIK